MLLYTFFFQSRRCQVGVAATSGFVGTGWRRDAPATPAPTTVTRTWRGSEVQVQILQGGPGVLCTSLSGLGPRPRWWQKTWDQDCRIEHCKGFRVFQVSSSSSQTDRRNHRGSSTTDRNHGGHSDVAALTRVPMGTSKLPARLGLGLASKSTHPRHSPPVTRILGTGKAYPLPAARRARQWPASKHKYKVYPS